ncbi:ArsR/SmtB family transcription factor [Microbacterium indicum]|uniref:ArsR/SmtB family transcription factor n=1 Tax=Microbacterium indicum TaxID=358100 RepID=UPI00042A3DFB|nr:metalloregulator ArsR/SmtB family transcription factor [Microbacterium indicum]
MTATRIHAALADDNRLRILDRLSRGPAGPSSLARELAITRQGTAKHLAVLADAGLVESRRAGREVQYSARPDALRSAGRALIEAADRWDAQLALLRRAAEGS